MPSTYTANLGLEKPATGEQAGVWGTTVNHTFDFLDAGIDGSVTITLSAPGYTLQTNDGVDSLGRNKVIVFDGPLVTTGTVTIAPNDAKKIYFVTNQTGFPINFTQGTGGTFTLVAGRSAVIYANGGGPTAKVSGALADLQVNSLLVQTNLIVNGQITSGGAITFSGAVALAGGVTITAPCTVNIGSDAFGDLLYRSGAGPLARLGIGAPGQVLGVVAGAPGWVATAGVSIGMPVGSAVANRVLYTDGAGNLAQDAGLTYGAGAIVLKGAAPYLMIDVPAAGAARSLVFTTNTAPRWRLLVDANLETGVNNAGSNFLLQGYNDAGSSFFNHLACFRNGHAVFGIGADNYTAQVTIQNGVASQDALAVVGWTGQTGKLQTWRTVAGAVVASIDNAGNLVIATINGSVPGGGGGGLSLNAQGRLEIGVPAAAGHPLGTLHIGLDTSGASNCTIAMERATVLGVTALPTGVGRLFFYNNLFVIEYSSGGNRWYTYVPLTAVAGSAGWLVNTSPV